MAVANANVYPKPTISQVQRSNLSNGRSMHTGTGGIYGDIRGKTTGIQGYNEDGSYLHPL